MNNNYNENSSGFIKPDAEEYKKKRKNKSNTGNIDNSEKSSNDNIKDNSKKIKEKNKQINYKNIVDINSNKELEKRKGDLYITPEEKIDPAEEKKKNIIFVVTVALFLVIVIFSKVAYTNMQKDEMQKLAKTKWFVYNEEDAKKVGYLELIFNSNGTFDMYKADTQVSCMSGKYSVIFKGKLNLKCDERGFNPPGEWKCKTKSKFKYKINDDKMKLTYKGVDVTFSRQGDTGEAKLDANLELLHKKYFINEQAKMLVTFYMGNMYIYTLEKTNYIFGQSGEVLGNVCFSGEYTLNQDKKTIKVDVKKDLYEITSNPMWEDMTEFKTYKFKYKFEEDFSKITLQYGDKAYEFKKYIIGE